MILEMMEGKDLLSGTRLFLNNYSMNQRAAYYIQLADDLNILHKTYSLVHSDINANNVMFKYKENTILKWIDYGGSTNIG